MVKNIFISLFILLLSFHLALSQENYQFSGHLNDKFLETPIPNAANCQKKINAETQSNAKLFENCFLCVPLRAQLLCVL